MTDKDVPWSPLDPHKADYRAAFGAFVAGCTLLEIRPGLVTVTGVCSCGSRESAETIARDNRGSRDKDRHVTRATLLSWIRESK